MSYAEIADLIADVLRPAHFFVGRGMELICEHQPAEEVLWETYHGQLLSISQSRQRKTFAAWNIFLRDRTGPSAEPVLSVKLDRAERTLHVVRAIFCHVWEGYDAGDNVILSREVTQWVRELVASIRLDQFPSEDDLRKELSCRLFQAVVGTSRLPLTSVEAPLPAFSLGQLAFFDRKAPVDRPMTTWRDLIGVLWATQTWTELAKLLETVLRTIQPEEVGDVARLFAQHWPKSTNDGSLKITRLLRTLFNEVSLSPYTHFVDSVLAFIQCLVDQRTLTIEEQIDFLSYLLRQLGRHLTAYDLVTFHHRGANYPDALLLDAILRAYLLLIETKAELFSCPDNAARSRRRALRQGCLLRRLYEGHLVPDAPTSPGENARVLPPPHVRVPEEQLLEPAKRKKKLYDGDPLAGLIAKSACRILQLSIDDLNDDEELRELGTAIFIDRTIDDAILLSHEAFSRAIARRRLAELEGLTKELGLDFAREALQMKLTSIVVDGLPIHEVHCPNKPIVSLADARRVSEDFVVVRTLPGSLAPLANRLDIGKIKLLVRLADPDDCDGMVTILDDALNRSELRAASMRER